MGLVPPDPKGEPGAFDKTPVSSLSLYEPIWLYWVPTVKKKADVKSCRHEVLPHRSTRETIAARDSCPIFFNFMRFLHPGHNKDGAGNWSGEDCPRLHCKTGEAFLG
jgi:hypothetical protein